MDLREQFRTSARGTLRSAATAFGEFSSEFRMSPTFIIAGAQRCATTSLFRMLAQHPQVRPPLLNKGVHYFDTAERFQRGPRFYKGHFPVERTHKLRSTITGEASPYYFFHPLAISRISNELPDIKLIVLLRDPVERAFSAYKQERGRGFEQLTFEEALQAEPERLAGEEQRIRVDPTYQSFSHQHHAYVARGRYAGQLEQAYRCIGKDRLLVLDADDFFAPGALQWPMLTNFLGIDDWLPGKAVHSNARPSSTMPAGAHRWLTDQFTGDDEELTRLMDAVPSWRR